MKITRRQLRRLIKEELSHIFEQAEDPPAPVVIGKGQFPPIFKAAVIEKRGCDSAVGNGIARVEAGTPGGVRGADASTDPAGATMTFWANDIADEQAAKDVVSFLATLN